MEHGVGSPLRHRAEQLPELLRLGLALRLLTSHRVRVDHRRGDREQLTADVDDPSEEGLPLLELRLPTRHPVERRAGELAGGALHVAQVLGERAELLVGARILALPDRELRQPLAVEDARLHRRIRLGFGVTVPHQESARRLEMRVDRLARDQQVHDLA